MTTDSGTYDDATRARQKMAAALLGNTLKPEENVKHWAQGLANIAKAGIGGYMGYQANEEAKAEKAQGQADLYTALGLPAPAKPAESPGMFSKIGALLSGGGAPDASPAAVPGGDQASYPPPAAPASPPTTFRPGIAAPEAAPVNAAAPDYGKAIAGIESGGAYDKLGPQTKTGDRAFGKYQVMGNNIPEWTTQVLGKPMTPEQFLANPDAQEAVFKAKFGDYVQKYGPEGAAKAWFAGEKGMNNPAAKDVLGTTVAGYGQKFTQALGPQIPPEIASGQSAAPQIASALASPTPAAPPAAAPAGVLAGVPQEAKAQIARLLSSNNPTAKAMGTTLLQNAISDKVTYQTTPDGDILAMDPHGRLPPKVVYKAGAKPIAVPENSQLYDPATKSFISGGQPAPTSVPGPDGNPIPIPQGLSSKDTKEFTKRITESTADAATGKKTEVQGAAEQFANRMENAEKNFKGLETQASGISGAAQTIAGKIPVVGAAAQSKDFQKMDQAKSQFITALLRKESGAAISKDEFNRYEKEFFPQPGNPPEVIAQKAEARRVAVEAMKKTAGPSYKSPTASPSEPIEIDGYKIRAR